MNPKSHLRLKLLRKLCGNLTQAAIAQKVGVAKSTIVAVEVGALKLSHGLANRIAAATGINPGWLLSSPGDNTPSADSAPVDCLRRPYTSDTWAVFGQVRTPGTLPSHFTGVSQDTTLEVDRMLRAAATRSREVVAAQFVRETVFKCLDDLNLKEAFLREPDYARMVEPSEIDNNRGTDWGHSLAPSLLSPSVLRAMQSADPAQKQDLAQRFKALNEYLQAELGQPVTFGGERRVVPAPPRPKARDFALAAVEDRKEALPVVSV